MFLQKPRQRAPSGRAGVNGAEFFWGCRGLAPAVFKTQNGLNPFRSKAADGGFPENARHFPVVKMPRPVGGEIHFYMC
jgi:hypothetical protein